MVDRNKSDNASGTQADGHCMKESKPEAISCIFSSQKTNWVTDIRGHKRVVPTTDPVSPVDTYLLFLSHSPNIVLSTQRSHTHGQVSKDYLANEMTEFIPLSFSPTPVRVQQEVRSKG
ncbi:hypothetical protein BgiMline_023090 [Biomphalaria glabrata]|nr:hypothetical protein BgiMline_010894 [Biomphalaria glabrata]